MAVVDIVLGTYSLQSSSVITSELQHESSPPINLDVLEVPFKDGGALTSKTFSPRKITLSGSLRASTQADLDVLIDTFKKNTNVIFENLDIVYASSFRRYRVTTSAVTISRGRGNITICGFSLSFDVINYPFGRQVSALSGSDVMNESFSFDINGPDQIINETVTYDGTAKPRPIIKMVIDNPSDLQIISLRNKTNQQATEIASDFMSGNELVIDTEEKSVTIDGKPTEYTGVIPDFELGSNKLEVFLSSTGAYLNSYLFNQVQPIVKDTWYGIIFHDATQSSNILQIFLAKNSQATGRVRFFLMGDNGDGIFSVFISEQYIDVSLIGVGYSYINIQMSGYSPAGFPSVELVGLFIEPEDSGTVIYWPYIDTQTASFAAFKNKNMRSAIRVAREFVYKSYIPNTGSAWKIDTSSKYNKKYL